MLLLLLLSTLSFSAPHPATSSSALLGLDQGLFMSPHGFSLRSTGTDWKLVEKGPPESLNEARYLPGKEGSVGSLSVRVDVLKNPIALEQYAKKWIKDYPGYGFTVLGNKTFSNKGMPGYVVDLVHSKKQKQIRQILYSKGRQAIILTCADDQRNFKETLKACNSIARTFTWSTTK